MAINSPVQTCISVPVIHNTEVIRKLTEACTEQKNADTDI